MTPDVLIVGHIAKDITNDGWRAGGSVLYAGEQCRRLGLNVAAVTICSAEIDPETLLPGVSWHTIRDTTSTTFENRYVEGRRSQRVLAQARQIGLDDIPEAWQTAPIVMLMPIMQDVDEAIISAFACSATLLSVSVQGWLRELDITRVRPVATLPTGKAWQGADVVFLSEEDVARSEAVSAWAPFVPNVVLTRAHHGCTVWHDGIRTDLPAFDAREIDPTGAGDVFAAAFTVRLHESGDSLDAARFASAAAVLAVEGVGLTAVGDRAAIEARLVREAA